MGWFKSARHLWWRVSPLEKLGLAWLVLFTFVVGCYVYTGARVRPDDYKWNTDHCSFIPQYYDPYVYCEDEGRWEYHRDRQWHYVGR